MSSVIRCVCGMLGLRGGRPITVTTVRHISGKMMRVSDPKAPAKPAPWPYQEKPYRIWHRLFDRTTSRFDENTKVSGLCES